MTEPRAPKTPDTMRRKAGADRPPPDIPPATPTVLLAAAIARAGDAAAGLVIHASEVVEDHVALSGVKEDLGESDLIALVEGPDSRFGVVVGDANLIAALIECQTIGRVLTSHAPLRPSTRTDAVMCADFIDHVLEMFERAMDDAALSLAAQMRGYRFAVRLDDARAVSMALPDALYRRIQAKLDLGGGAKCGALTILLPFETHAAKQGTRSIQKDDPMPPSVVLRARADLRAVLHRTRLTLDELTAFAPGMTITLPREVVDEVSLEDLSGRNVARCCLGQAKGQRALRIVMNPADGSAPEMVTDKPQADAALAVSTGPAAVLPQVDETDTPDIIETV